MSTRQNFLGLGKSSVTYHRRGASFAKGAHYKGYRIWEDENGWHTSLDPSSWFDSKSDVKRFMDSWLKNPPKGWFKRCVEAVKAKGGAYDPNAVCAAEERRLGKPSQRNLLPFDPYTLGLASQAGQRIQKQLRGRGKSRNPRNPEAEAAEAFEQFHGFPARDFIDVDKDIHFHSKLWLAGELVQLSIIGHDGQIVDLTGFKGAMLCGNEAGTQLYIEDGDQQVDCKAFGIREPYHDKEDLGAVDEVRYDTRKDHLGPEGGQAIYYHHFGEEEGKHAKRFEGNQPRLIYDTVNATLEFVGGKYTIRPEGIKN